MNIPESIVAQATAQGAILRGRVTEVTPEGEILVARPDDPDTGVPCDVLVTAGAAPLFRAGEEVLFIMPETGATRGCVLGVVARPHAAEDVDSADGRTAWPSVIPRVVEVRAEEHIRLACGDSSISLRRDGTVIIRGERILSRARGTQRIKGGSVQIN